MSASDARLTRRRLVRRSGVYTIDEDNAGEIELEQAPAIEPEPPAEAQDESWDLVARGGDG
jgi:hypothetical protein